MRVLKKGMILANHPKRSEIKTVWGMYVAATD